MKASVTAEHAPILSRLRGNDVQGKPLDVPWALVDSSGSQLKRKHVASTAWGGYPKAEPLNRKSAAKFMARTGFT